jgi:hypothetical protein
MEIYGPKIEIEIFLRKFTPVHEKKPGSRHFWPRAGGVRAIYADPRSAVRPARPLANNKIFAN